MTDLPWSVQRSILRPERASPASHLRSHSCRLARSSPFQSTFHRSTATLAHPALFGSGVNNYKGKMKQALAVIVPLVLCLPGLAAADATQRCRVEILKGQYVFTASGFTRAPNSAPGTPWVPKAILEVLHFNGDGTLSTPDVTVANPFGDSGAVLQPGPGAAGVYTVNDDCTGTVQFLDASNVTFKIYVEPVLGANVWMIQTNPANNVFQGSAKRVF